MNIVEGKILNMCQEIGFQMYEEDKEYYVDAEELWDWLGVKTDFRHWINRRITTYKFEENVDYITLYYKEESENDFKKFNAVKFDHVGSIENARIVNCENLKKLSEFENDNQASRYGYKKKYFIKSDMAKHLAMVEDADKGKQVREFYLQLEQYIDETNQWKYVQMRFVSAKEHSELHDLIGDEGKCIGLDKAIYQICSYKLNLHYMARKEDIYQIKKANIEFYQDIMRTASHCVQAFRLIDDEHYISNVIKALKNKFVDNENNFTDYCKTHKTRRFIAVRGFGKIIDKRDDIDD